MAVKLATLKQTNAQQHITAITGLLATAAAFKKLGDISVKVPGIPNIPKMIKQQLEKLAKPLPEKAKEQLLILIGIAMAAGAKELIKIVPKINKIIEAINKLIDKINAALQIMMNMIKAIFPIIIALTIIFVVAKIVGMIPAITVGLGAGVAFTMHIQIAAELQTMTAGLLQVLTPIPFAIMSVMLMLLGAFGFMKLMMGMLNNFMNQQTNMSDSAAAAAATSGDGWEDSTNDDDQTATDELDLVECTLPNGEVEKMTPEECIAAGGTFPGMELIKELNDVNAKINNFGKEIVDCLLPDGTISQMSLEECIAAGGRSLSADELARLLAERARLMSELGNLSSFQMGDNIITSLLHTNDDVTIEKSIEKRGRRHGFYGAVDFAGSIEEDDTQVVDEEDEENIDIGDIKDVVDKALEDLDI